MSGINKYSFIRWILGIALVATSGIALASNVTGTFATNDPLTATKMNEITGAINDNDTRVTNIQTGTGACVKNAGDETGGVVRVGSLCVDKFRARGTKGTCTADGLTNCGSFVALSNTTGSALTSVSYAQAAVACANAGKRLLTPGELVMVWTKAASVGITDITTDAVAEWVSSAGDGGGGTNPLNGAYVGPNLGGSGSDVLSYRANADYRDDTLTFIFFRCVR